jgi:hypothetical protein
MVFAVLFAAGLGAAWLYDKANPDQRAGWKLAWWMFLLPVWVFRAAFSGSRWALASADVPLPALWGPRRVRRPESVELVPRQAADPSRYAGGARHGSWEVLARDWPAVHCAVVSQPGGAKGQTAVNYAIEHQLERSPEHLIILDVKPELEDIVRRYARPDDRIFLYTSHAAKPKSSALNLFADLDVAGEVAKLLVQPELSKDPYWPKKAGNLIEAIARHYNALRPGAVSLGAIYDVVSDRGRLAELRDRDPRVDNVADNVKEWGSIRSNALEALYAMQIPRVRRMFDPMPKTTQPYFGPGAPRTIVILQPSEELADTLAPLVAAEFHGLYMLAAAGGWAGGAGTKVVADEAASFLALERLPRYLEIGRGRKVQLMYVLQSRKQLVDVLGEDRADRTLASTELQLVGATSDLATAEYLSRLSGEERVFYRGPAGASGRRHHQEHMRARVLPHEVTSQRRGDWTVRLNSEVLKFRVPESAYYYRQQHPKKQPLRVWGIPKRQEG